MSPAAWAAVAERGSILGMRITVWFYRAFGRRLCAWFILPVVGYFFLTDRRGRQASRRYLERLYGSDAGRAALSRAPRLVDCFAHYQAFGLAILDRLTFALGRGDEFELLFHGREHFTSFIAEKRGAILLGAHLGSFDALRALAVRAGVVVHVLMFTRHAERINGLLRRLNPAIDLRVIDLGVSPLETLIQLKGHIEKGEFVAMLGDRVRTGRRARVIHVPFLGAPAPFPGGPFLLANALACPVVLMVGLRRNERTYDIFAEPLADRVTLSLPHRTEQLRELVTRYARRLEAYCAHAPYQWFNFYDFWADERS